MGRIALALLACLAIFAAAVGAGQHTTYQGPFLPALATSLRAPILWRDKLDFGLGGGPSTVLAAGEGRLFYVRDGVLVAADLKSGRRLWSTGSGLRGPVAAGGDRVYAPLSNGRVAAFSSDGRPLWTSSDTIRHIEEFVLHGSLLVVSHGNGAVAFDQVGGRRRWSIHDNRSVGPAGTTARVLLWQVFIREYDFRHLRAYLWTTGRQAFLIEFAAEPLAIENDQIFVRDESPSSHPELDDIQIRVINRYGREVQRWRYPIDKKCLGQISVDAGMVVLDGAYVYISEGCGDRISRFPRGGARKPLATYPIFDRGRWIAGPYCGFLFFETEQHALVGVPAEGGLPAYVSGVTIPTGQPRWYQGVDNPISRLDLLSNLVLVGQTDGVFHAFDLSSGRRLFSVRTAGRSFGPSIQVGPYVAVQAQGELLVLKAPR